jgi:uroporphyrinogen decarboxylase
MTTHRERVQACLRGESTDQPPVALWRHFPVDDQTPDALAAAHVAFQRAYDFDVLKVTPASSFCLKDWGVDDVWEGNTEGTRRYTKTVIREPRGWEHLPVLDPDAPHLAAQIACLRKICRQIGEETPIVQTVFNPLAQAKHLAGEQTLLLHLREYPEALMKGLDIIAQSTRRFVEAVAEVGVDGIFYAVQHAQASLLSRAEFTLASRSFDLEVLSAASALWCNILHLHGRDVYFDAVADYPVHVINWHDRETSPSLLEARGRFRGSLCGGLGRDTLVYNTPLEIRREAKQAIADTGGKGLILSTGCVVPIIVPHGNLLAARASVERPAATGGPEIT